MALVLKSWEVDESPVDREGNFIKIKGRHGGLISFFLSLVGVDPTVTIKINSQRLEFTKASLAGGKTSFIPLASLTSTHTGFHRPWQTALAIFIVSMFLGSFLGPIFGRLVGGFAGFLCSIGFILSGLVIGVIYYILNREITLGFIEGSGVGYQIDFKRSVIENIDVNEKRARQACDIVQDLIQAVSQAKLQTVPSQPGKASREPASRAVTVESSQQSDTISVSCPGCGADYNISASNAGRKFRCQKCRTIIGG